MNKKDEQTQDLKAVLEVGLAVQTIAVIVSFCIKRNKLEFLSKLNELIASLNNSLSDEEKKELRSDLDRMIKQKSEDFLIQLGSELTEEEINKALSELKSIAS